MPHRRRLRMHVCRSCCSGNNVRVLFAGLPLRLSRPSVRPSVRPSPPRASSTVCLLFITSHESVLSLACQYCI
ncbi:hypothetical protein BD309DRAFT_944831, partial [Dichomitus squalens]